MLVNLDKPGDILTFDKEFFLKDYFDKEGDLPFEIEIQNLPIYGILKFDNKVINVNNFTFDIKDVSKFIYVRISSAAYSEDIDFKLSDNNPNKLFSEMKTFTINVNAYVNLPPSIGDGETTINFNEVKVFTVDDFTINTVPPYSDPENNPPYKLKILSLPVDGKVQFDGVDVTLNQEIFFTDIALGKLTAFGDNSIETPKEVTFDFTISDTGSQQYAS